MNLSLSRREAALVLVTALWGGTFLAVQVALQWASPFALVGVRFGLAATLLGVVLWWRGELRGLNRFEVRAGLILGVWVYLGFGLQTAGLLHIDSSQSAFLTALYVPLVPLVLWLWKRQLPTAWAWLAIGMAVAGTYALTGAHTNLASMNIGDWLTVACALAFAMEIVLLGHYSQHCQPVRLAWVITLTVAVLAWATSGVMQESGVQPSWTFVALIVGLACVTAFVQFAMSWAQQSVPETRATLIYSMEPVWAALVGALAGERLGLLGLLGGALIVLAMWVGKLKPVSP
jgi:drug/metabolite transporter (DMT)-like permease